MLTSERLSSRASSNMWLANLFFSLFASLVASTIVVTILHLLGIELVSPWSFFLGGGMFLLFYLPGNKRPRNSGNNDLFPGM